MDARVKEFLNREISREEYIESVDPKGACIYARAIICKEIIELCKAISSRFFNVSKKEKKC